MRFSGGKMNGEIFVLVIESIISFVLISFVSQVILRSKCCEYAAKSLTPRKRSLTVLNVVILLSTVLNLCFISLWLLPTNLIVLWSCLIFIQLEMPTPIFNVDSIRSKKSPMLLGERDLKLKTGPLGFVPDVTPLSKLLNKDRKYISVALAQKGMSHRSQRMVGSWV